MVTIVCAMTVTACSGGGRPSAARSAASGDVLFVGTSAGIAAVSPADGAVAFTVPGGVAAPDWSVLYRSRATHGGTEVSALRPDGSTLWSSRIDGHAVVKLASPGGAALVLGPRYSSGGRPRTDLVVGRMGLSQPAFRTYHVPGNVEPEAISLDQTTLFLIEYVPAMHPTGYQLRRLDLGTGALRDVPRVDQDETGVMHGIARTHVMSRDGARLYTLYTVSEKRAFVHVLDLRDKYAHCVDLPLPFGTGPQSAVALALTPDGSRLFVADRHSGAAAVVDTTRLTIDNTGTVPLAGSTGPAGAVMGGDGTLYVASGRHVVEVMPMSLDYQGAIDLPAPAAAMGMAPSGELVAGLGGRHGLLIIDPVTHRTTALAPRSLGDITYIGAVAAAPLDRARTSTECAC